MRPVREAIVDVNNIKMIPVGVCTAVDGGGIVMKALPYGPERIGTIVLVPMRILDYDDEGLALLELVDKNAASDGLCPISLELDPDSTLVTTAEELKEAFGVPSDFYGGTRIKGKCHSSRARHRVRDALISDGWELKSGERKAKSIEVWYQGGQGTVTVEPNRFTVHGWLHGEDRKNFEDLTYQKHAFN